MRPPQAPRTARWRKDSARHTDVNVTPSEHGVTTSVTDRKLSVTCIEPRSGVASTKDGLIAGHLGGYPERDVIGPAEPPQRSHTELLSSSGCSSHGPGHRRHRAVLAGSTTHRHHGLPCPELRTLPENEAG